eukprot:Sdes_comp20636_c0_seq1m15803
MDKSSCNVTNNIINFRPTNRVNQQLFTVQTEENLPKTELSKSQTSFLLLRKVDGSESIYFLQSQTRPILPLFVFVSHVEALQFHFWKRIMKKKYPKKILQGVSAVKNNSLKSFSKFLNSLRIV